MGSADMGSKRVQRGTVLLTMWTIVEPGRSVLGIPVELYHSQSGAAEITILTMILAVSILHKAI